MLKASREKHPRCTWKYAWKIIF